jgi:hypothetical protein
MKTIQSNKIQEITPKLNDQVHSDAYSILMINGINNPTRKQFNDAYDAAIIQLGYLPVQFKKVMRQIGHSAY